jgi:hypothetical protein
VAANICLPRYGGRRCTNKTLVDMGPWMPWAKPGVQTPTARYRAGVLARAVGEGGTLGMTTSTVHGRNTFRTLFSQKRAVAGGRLPVPLATACPAGFTWNTDAAVAGEVRAARLPYLCRARVQTCSHQEQRAAPSHTREVSCRDGEPAIRRSAPVWRLVRRQRIVLVRLLPVWWLLPCEAPPQLQRLWPSTVSFSRSFAQLVHVSPHRNTRTATSCGPIMIAHHQVADELLRNPHHYALSAIFTVR